MSEIDEALANLRATILTADPTASATFEIPDEPEPLDELDRELLALAATHWDD